MHLNNVAKIQRKTVDQKSPFCYNNSIVRKQEFEMDHKEFESNVSYIVRPLLNDNEHAGFFGDTGTLFAACSKSTADNIFDRLTLEFGVGKVQLNGPIQGEYAYDFV